MVERILLLQGPVGPFFRRFAEELGVAGHTVIKVNFNGGDKVFFSGPAAIDYRGSIDEWASFLSKLLVERRIDRIYLHGDCRRYHVIARTVAKQIGIRVYVFEEGYLRPHFITLEEGGVNGNSSIPRVANHYRDSDSEDLVGDAASGTSFFHAAFYAIVYYVASVWLSAYFPHYRHHRPLNVFPEGWRWVVAGWRKLKYRVSEYRRVREFLREQAPPFFLVPLQVHVDTQLLVHSPFSSVEQFIAEVVTSFAKHAPSSSFLLIKHHPLDRGYKDYTKVIRQAVRALGVGHRVVYIHDWSLPKLFERCVGVVTVNSTVGLSALHHGKPVKTLGWAVYDMAGLTFQGELDAFWRNPGLVDRDLYLRFRAWLLRNNQAAGSFYRMLHARRGPTGLAWPRYLVETHGLGDRLAPRTREGDSKPSAECAAPSAVAES